MNPLQRKGNILAFSFINSLLLQPLKSIELNRNWLHEAFLEARDESKLLSNLLPPFSAVCFGSRAPP